MHVFSTVEKIVTGAGSFNKLGELAAPFGRRVMIVTGRHAMKASGSTARAKKLLAAANIESFVFDNISGEPTDAEVDAAREFRRVNNCDLVIGLGGGSPIDVAKCAAALAHVSAPTRDFLLGKTSDAPNPLPHISIPTTSGTGTEVTFNSVISVPDIPLKTSIRVEGLLPNVALVDSELTLTCPPEITAASGLDALTQSVESYVSIHATPITRALALRSIELLARSLERAYHDGNDREARDACSYGSLIGGMAFTNSRLGVVHGIAHPLGVRYHIAHGVVCGILLPPSIRLNREAAGIYYDEISRAIGCDIEKFAESLLDKLGIGRTFAKWKLDARDFPTIARESMPSGSLKANPHKVTEDDIVRILNETC